MSLLDAIFGKIQEARQQEKQRHANNYEGLVALIIDQVLSPTVEPKTDSDKAEVENVIELHADYLQECMKAGVATEDEIKSLCDSAFTLKRFLESGESPEVDTTKLEEKFRDMADKYRAELADAQRAIHMGRQANFERIESRQAAQRLILERPELAAMANAMELSWTPKTTDKRPNEQPSDEAVYA